MPDHATARPEGDTLAACTTRVMLTPTRRLAARRALQAALGCPGHGRETATSPYRGNRTPAATAARIPTGGSPAAAMRTAATATAATANYGSGGYGDNYGSGGYGSGAPYQGAATPGEAAAARILYGAAGGTAGKGPVRGFPPAPGSQPRSIRQVSSPPGTPRPPEPGRAGEMAAREGTPGRSPRRPSTDMPSPTTRSWPSPIRPPTLPLPRPGRSWTTGRQAAGRTRAPGATRPRGSRLAGGQPAGG